MLGEGVEVLAEVDGHIVAAQQGKQLVTAFHPELGTDTRVHELFAKMLKIREKMFFKLSHTNLRNSSLNFNRCF